MSSSVVALPVQIEDLDGLRENVARWNESVRRAENLQHVAEELIGVVQLLVELVESPMEARTLSKADLLKALGKPEDEFVAGAGEPLRVAIGEQAAEIRGRLADLQTFLRQPSPVKVPES